jgi:hypothetical protein
MAELVARRCWELRGAVPLILSRGYQGGDEARMVQRRMQLANIPALIGVGPDRVEVAKKVIACSLRCVSSMCYTFECDFTTRRGNRGCIFCSLRGDADDVLLC